MFEKISDMEVPDKMTSNIETLIQLNISEDTKNKWQNIIDIMAKILNVPAGLIMRIVDSDITVFLSSKTENNPYKPGAKEHLKDSGLYCETVIKTSKMLIVPNALSDEHWKNNPDIKLNMISYLGFPITLPDKTPFGTICVLDNKENKYSELYKDLIISFRDTIEKDIELFYLNYLLNEKNNQLIHNQVELETSRERYLNLYDLAPIGYFTINEKGLIMEANLKCATLLGVDRKLLINQLLSNFILPADQDLYYLSRKKLLDTGTPQTIELRMRRPDATTFRTRFETITAKDKASGETIYYIVISDITERKQAAEALIESKEKYEMLFQSIPIGVTISDKSGNIVEVNHFSEKLLGLSKSEQEKRKINGQEWKIIRNDGTIMPVSEYASMRALTENRLIENVEMGILKLDGETTWINVTATPLSLENYGVIITYNDITERKQAEKELYNANIFKKSILEGISDAFFSLNNEMEVTYFNNAAEKALGKKREEVIGRNLFDVFVEAKGSIFEKNYTVALKEKRALTFETYFGIEPYENWYEVRVHPHDKGISVFFQVITERKKSAEKIQNLLTEKEILLKEVHHRIKNNMNTVAGLMYLQLETLKEPSAIAALNDARSRVLSMMVLYDKLYCADNFNKLSLKEYLSPLVDEIINNFPNKGIVKVEKNINDLSLDAKRSSDLGIIINEILTNIMKYAFTGRDNGLITLSAMTIDNHMTITICDNGIGIPESVDIDNSTGFGLQLVHMMTKSLNGTIKIERNNGTKFILEFIL